MIKYLSIILLTFYSCNNKLTEVRTENTITKKGVLLSIGGGIDYFFIELDDLNEAIIERSILDTNNIAIQIFSILHSSGLKNITPLMKPFTKDYYKCGVWSDQNQVTYIPVIIYLMKDSESMTDEMKNYYNQINAMCLFTPSNNTFNTQLKYKFVNATLKKIEIRKE